MRLWCRSAVWPSRCLHRGHCLTSYRPQICVTGRLTTSSLPQASTNFKVDLFRATSFSADAGLHGRVASFHTTSSQQSQAVVKKFDNFRVEGAIVAPCTGMKENGDVNLDVIDQYVDYLVTNQVDGIYALGTMGEGMALSVEERKQVGEAWVKAGKRKLKSIILHIGATNIRDSMELARHAESLQVTAIACISPSYYKPANEEALVAYMEQVASCAPKTPFYYYDINDLTGIHLNAARFMELAGKRISTLVGLKFSYPRFPILLDCHLLEGGRYHAMVGTDEMFIPALSLGIEVPVLNAHVCSLFKRLKDAFDKNDMDTAREEQRYARKLVKIMNKYGGGIEAEKALMKILGIDLGPVRLPLEPLTHDQVASLKNELQDIGFLK